MSKEKYLRNSGMNPVYMSAMVMLVLLLCAVCEERWRKQQWSPRGWERWRRKLPFPYRLATIKKFWI